MATHSSTLAWKNPMDGGAWWAAVHGVAKSWTRLSDFTFTFHSYALEKAVQWQPTPVFLPGESQGQRSLVGCRVWGHTESDMSEATQQTQETDVYNFLILLPDKEDVKMKTEKETAMDVKRKGIVLSLLPWIISGCSLMMESWGSVNRFNIVT